MLKFDLPGADADSIEVSTDRRVLTVAAKRTQEYTEQERPVVRERITGSFARKVRLAEDAWNTRDPERVALAYTEDSIWRNRDTFVSGRAEIVSFLASKWERELDYALRKSLWTFDGNRIAVRFQYESHDGDGQWWRSYGNELWEFDEHGLMRRREASINDVLIAEKDRLFHWPLGPRPADHKGLSELGL